MLAQLAVQTMKKGTGWKHDPKKLSRGATRHPTPIHSLAASVFEHWTHAQGQGAGGGGSSFWQLGAIEEAADSRLLPLCWTSFLKEPVELPALKMVIITIPLT